MGTQETRAIRAERGGWSAPWGGDVEAIDRLWPPRSNPERVTSRRGWPVSALPGQFGNNRAGYFNIPQIVPFKSGDIPNTTMSIEAISPLLSVDCARACSAVM